MIFRPCHMIIRPNLRSGCSCASLPSATVGGIGRIVARHSPLTFATREGLRQYRLAINGIAAVFPDAALAID
jgi:hypothetical protein